MNAEKKLSQGRKVQFQAWEACKEADRGNQPEKHLRCGLKFYRVDDERESKSLIIRPKQSGEWQG